MRFIITLFQWIVGLLFIFSGLVKTIDPIGFSIKLEEYFSPSVFDLPFLMNLALPLAIFFVIFEVVLGVLLILGIYKRFTLWSLLILIIFFSFLTFYSAYFNKVTDCGCFGDAIKLTPWESFFKDIILLVMIVVLWFGQKFIKPLFVKSFATYITLAVFLICAYIAFHGIYHLPLIDFRPYAVGKNIPDGMKSAEELGLNPPRIETQYFLKNKLNNQKITLSQDKYINDKSYWESGTPWEIEKTDSKVVEKGYEPPIHDFVIDCGDNGDMTYHYLAKPKLVLIVTSVPFKASAQGLNRVSQFAESLKSKDYEILSVASDEARIANIPNCFMDPTTLKTMIRSNPGIILIKHGTVVGKYNWHDIPTESEIQAAFN
ncbi:MAG: DoxX family protein [Flavobacteriaceae bacterium]|nr:DoxX family protein [Flavobacteriaceae bacterium]